MKKYTIDEIISLARAKLDEIGLNDSEMAETDTDNANVNTIIKSCIADAYRTVAMLADVALIEAKDGSGATLSIDSNLVGKISLPSDFLRLVSVRLSSWVSSRDTAVPEDSDLYRMQSNKWVCGSPDMPVAALVNGPDGRALELYKAASTGDTLRSFTYVASIDKNASEVNISDQLADAFIYFVAGLTAVSLQEPVADNLLKIARGLIGVE